MRLKYAVDLFCGAGGTSEGIIQAGFHILFSSDINEDVQATYMNRHNQLGLVQNINTYYHRGDISELYADFIWKKIKSLEVFTSGQKSMPDRIDAVFGGPPCQGFSRAGQRKSNDPRNLLFKEYLRVISELHPRYVVMENVEGFNDTKFYGFVGLTGEKYPDGELAPTILLREFEKIGYNVLEPKVLDASDYGVPQRRRRAIFLAYRKGENPPQYPLPIYCEEDKISVRQAIGDLIDNKVVKKRLNPSATNYQRASKEGRTPDINGVAIPSTRIKNHEFSNHQAVVIERFSLFKEGEDGPALKRRILKEGIDLQDKPQLCSLCSERLGISKEEVVSKFRTKDIDERMLDILLTKKNIRTKLNAKEPSLTMVTLPDDYISPFENRVFSVREMARLQSFDDSFEFLGKRTTGGSRRKFEVPQYTQVGNAVPPLMAKAIALEIMQALDGKEEIAI